MRRYVIYDPDSGELLNHFVYNSYKDALDIAQMVNDVLILPIEIPGDDDGQESESE